MYPGGGGGGGGRDVGADERFVQTADGSRSLAGKHEGT